MSQDAISEKKPLKPNQFQHGNKLGKGRLLGSKNRKKELTKEQILRDIEFVYNKSVRENHWTNALAAKAWQGKFMGIARKRKLPDITKLSDMNQEQLKEFIEIMAEHDTEVSESLKPKEES